MGMTGEQDTDGLDTAGAVGKVGTEGQAAPAIVYPEGIDETWLTEKSKHLNKAHAEWFDPQYRKAIEENFRLYEGKRISGTLPGSTTIPIATSIVDTNTARLAGSVLGREKFVEAVPMDPQQVLAPQMEGEDGSPMDRNQTVEDFINEAFTLTPELPDKLDEVIKGALLETVGVAQAKWSVDSVWMGAVQREIVNGQPVAVGVSETEEERGFADFVPRALTSLAWDPRVKTKLRESAWIRFRDMVSANTLLKMEQDGIIEGAQYAIDHCSRANNNIQAAGSQDPDAQRSLNVESVNLPSVNYDDAIFELDEFWATLTWKDKEGNWQTGEFQYWVIGGECIVKFRPNPLKPQRKPFVSWKVSRKPGMFLSQGPVDVIKDICKDLATTMARKNKLLTRAANNPTYYEPASGLNARNAILQEASLVPVLSIAGIKQAEVPVQAIGVIDNHARFLIAQADRATANTEQAQGSGSEVDTATEAEILNTGSNIRFQYSSDGFLNAFVAPLCQEYFWMYRQFGQEGQMVIREAGMDGVARAVRLEDLMANYVFRAIPAQASGQKMQKFQMLSALMEKLLQAQTAYPGALTNDQGQPLQVNLYDMLTTQMLPLLDLKSNKGVFKLAPPPMPMMPQGMPPMGADQQMQQAAGAPNMAVAP